MLQAASKTDEHSAGQIALRAQGPGHTLGPEIAADCCPHCIWPLSLHRRRLCRRRPDVSYPCVSLTRFKFMVIGSRMHTGVSLIDGSDDGSKNSAAISMSCRPYAAISLHPQAEACSRAADDVVVPTAALLPLLEPVCIPTCDGQHKIHNVILVFLVCL